MHKIVATIAVLFSPAAIWTQGIQGVVTGIVQDPSQARVSGAQVTLTHIETGTSLKTTTNEAGVFRFPSVPLGSHELRVDFAGFKPYIQGDILVETGQTVRVDVQLEVGGDARERHRHG
jgi:hypothetical protein